MGRDAVSYSVQGSTAGKTFGAFNALGAIAFSFGDAMLPEIQVIFDASILRYRVWLRNSFTWCTFLFCHNHRQCNRHYIN